MTSFKAAQLVSELDDVDKVMFVVDRHDLDTQTQAEYEAFEPGAVDSTDNTDELVKRLHSNSKIIITTIQKLNAAVSKQFEKVKTQNKLRPQHIQKIVDTYRERKEIEKYSHLATLQEVAENDYNLNIPRYVDTFEEEEPIDIHAVMKEIKELEAKRADLDKEIEGYLKELGLV